jgi:tetratricopeptide (TPR) repeat protein
MTTRAQNVASALALAVLVGSAVLLQIAREARFPAAPLDERLLYLTSGKAAKKLALSNDALVADIYWIRAIQHYGGERGLDRPKRYDLLYPLLDLTTSLDPRFTVAYRFGAIFLMEPYPGGAGRPDLAVKLLEKGIQQTPERWEYYLDIGFVYYWRLGDYKKAAEWFQRGGDVPGGPWWLRTYAAVMLAKGGDRQSSRFLWRNIHESAADNDWLKQNAQLRLLQLDALDQIDQLQAVVREYRHRNGKLPESWRELVAARLLQGQPLDPAGTSYVLDSSTGAVTMSEKSKLFPLPVEPAATPQAGPSQKAPPVS